MSGARAEAALTGIRKAAILVTVLGEEAAAVILRQLSQPEVQRITAEVATLDAVAPELAQQVLDEYERQSTSRRFQIEGGTEYAVRMLHKAFGEEEATELVKKVAQERKKNAGEFEWLRNTDPQQLASFLETESPQTCAVILSHLDPKHSSSILAKFQSESRTEIVKRMAQLRQYSPEVAEAISNVLNQKLKPASPTEKKPARSPASALPELLNHLEPTTSKEILDALEKENSKLANDLRNLMFTFEDLIGVPETALREWVAAIDKKTLALALKGASQPVRDHIYKSMSSRAVEMLKEDMDVMGRVRAKEVAEAQQSALATARQLEAEGKIVLKAEAEDEFVA
jgi:flagellar motor switch protein FliG